MLVRGNQKLEEFTLERFQSLFEHRVEINLSESGVHPATLRELAEMGLELDEILDTRLEYVQTNGTPALREAISAWYVGTTPEQIQVTNGTSEANFLLTSLLAAPGSEVVCAQPNYRQVVGLAAALGANVRTFDLVRTPGEGWSVDCDEVVEKIRDATSLVYVSQPNNPTGFAFSQSDARRIAERAAEVGATLLSDEVYRGSEHDGNESASFWGLSPAVVVTCGLSKAYGLPGTRIGWIVGSAELVADCWALHDYTTIAPGALSDAIARFALTPDARRKLTGRARELMVANADLFDEWSQSLGGKIDYERPRAGAYGFARYSVQIGSEDLCELLRKEHDVLLVAGAWMGLESYLRFSLGCPRDYFERGLERVGTLLERLT